MDYKFDGIKKALILLVNRGFVMVIGHSTYR